MEIIQERLEREFGLALIATAPSVRYRIETVQGETIEIDNPSKLPPVGDIVAMSEPYVRGRSSCRRSSWAASTSSPRRRAASTARSSTSASAST